MELDEALSQIAEIRRQMARTEVFRGYRAVTVAASGLLAWGATAVQAWWIPRPQEQLTAYLTLWLGAAVISAVAAGFEMAYRARQETSRWTRELNLLALEQFLPCLFAGGLLTFAVVRYAPAQAWMLPGLWSILFSLGVFASRRLLPPAIFLVAVYYLAAGVVVLSRFQGDWALSPWAMGVPFGVGQLLASAVLYRTLEWDHGQG